MPKSHRYAFLDVLRGFAVLWMVQVHLTNVLIDSSFRGTLIFDLLNISNGFVAPAFIFCSGAGLWIALDRKGASYLRRGADLWLYLRRLAYILLWAYMLHVPFYSLERTLIATPQELMPWLQTDVLQTIVYASLIALTCFLIIRDLRKTTIVYGVLSILLMSVTVFIWDSNPATWLPESLAIMILPAPSSLFPLFPWMCYLFAGAFFTGVFMRSENRTLLAQRMIWLSIAGTGLIFLLKILPFNSPWTHTWWSTSPGLHLFRISGVVLVMSVLYLFEQRLRNSRFGIEMQIIGNESLFLYISHLLIVYGSASLIVRSITGVSSTGYLGIAIVWVALTVPLLFITKWWHTIKHSKPELARKILVGQMCIMILAFLLIPADFSVLEIFGVAGP
ncbi:MAG: DUF1624 domain-containing protein [Ignavibacteria bacterium]|nr:DUF1624 domain-containing protein [Ignavibacteria bacterium]